MAQRATRRKPPKSEKAQARAAIKAARDVVGAVADWTAQNIPTISGLMYTQHRDGQFRCAVVGIDRMSSKTLGHFLANALRAAAQVVQSGGGKIDADNALRVAVDLLRGTDARSR
jgi:hypothetical protein